MPALYLWLLRENMALPLSPIFRWDYWSLNCSCGEESYRSLLAHPTPQPLRPLNSISVPWLLPQLLGSPARQFWDVLPGYFPVSPQPWSPPNSTSLGCPEAKMSPQCASALKTLADALLPGPPGCSYTVVWLPDLCSPLGREGWAPPQWWVHT